MTGLRHRIVLFILFLVGVSLPTLFAAGTFEMTTDGMRYVVRDAGGNVVQTYQPSFDSRSGAYVVKDRDDHVIAQQPLHLEAAMDQVKIVAPISGEDHSVTAKTFLGNPAPVLRELPSNDPRYAQLKGYIENDPGLRNVLAMQLQARNMKIEKLQQQISAGTRDPQLTQWLVNDLKKPVYLEVGDSGQIYHDGRGFILAEKGNNGQVTYRDNAYANRLVIPGNSEAFQGGMSDSSAASVMAHEVGHMIMDQAYETPNYPKTRYAGPHSKDSITDEGFAISEGWAEAIETLSNKDRLDNSSSWRIQSQKNIADNKYIFKNQGVLEGANDGVLKNGIQQLSTEGVNATLFYKMLQDNRIQMPFEKVVKVFQETKPQTYRDFLKDYVQMYPEDRSTVIRNFLENTKYATVDSSAGARYKALFDAEQAYRSAPPETRSQLQSEYQARLNEYNQWKEQLYQKTVVDGKIDAAVSGNNAGDATVAAYSDQTKSEYRSIKLSETLLKGKKALATGMQRAGDSIKQSFSWQNMAITAGTAVAVNLASQIMNGEKPSLKTAAKAVASWQFVGNVMGSTFGAAAGHCIAPLIQTFVPIPIVGALAGTLLPTMTAIAGGSFGGNLGAGMSFKQALKNLDPWAIAGQAIGSTVGAMLGSMIPIPIVGQVIGGMVGGILGEKLFKGLAKLFGFGKDKNKAEPLPAALAPAMPTGLSPAFEGYRFSEGPPVQAADADDPSHERIDPSIDRIPYGQMHPNLRVVKDDYEAAYSAYVQALSSGDQSAAQAHLKRFVEERERYRRALGAYLK